jgi:hypothetical protein
LLLAFATTVILGFGSHDHISLLSKAIYLFCNSGSSSTRGGVGLPATTLSNLLLAFARLSSQPTSSLWSGNLLVALSHVGGQVNCCWPSPAQLFLVPSPEGCMTVFFSFTALTAGSLYIALYQTD